MSDAYRVLVIGLDGATYDVLTPLAALGVMPNVARLMDDAALAELTSTRPYITPVAWTTFQTGCDPQSHGIWDYRYLDHGARQLALNQADRIRCPTLFDAISADGGEVVSLNLPMTYPPRDLQGLTPPGSPAGLVVGGLDCPSIEAALAPYPEFQRRLRAGGVRFNLGTVWKRPPATFEELSQRVAETRADFLGRAAAACIADELHDWRLMFVQFQTLDALQHRCWHLLGIDESCTAPTAWVEKLHEALRALDDSVGELLELAARRGAGVVVVSDHGFGSFRGKISLPHLLASRGLLVPSNRFGHVARQLSRLPWKARKWLRRRVQPGASTASLRRPLASLLPIDWRRSSAVTLHGNLAGLAYLNTPERFGRGPLTTPRLVEQATADLLACFGEARHPETGERLFEQVWATRERFGVDPVELSWPDVVAIPTAGFHTRSKLDGGAGLVTGDENLTGTHRVEGVLMVSGAKRPADGLRAELRDVAPTILHMLGIRPCAPITGRVLQEMIGSPAATATAPAERPANTPPAAVDDRELETVEARLHDLGYLD